MIFVNKKGRVVYANAKCEETMEYKREEFYSPDFDFLNLIAPEFKDSVKLTFMRHMKGEDVSPYEYALITKEGKRIEVIGSTKIVEYDGENAILGIITDITERKKMEDTLLESEKNLATYNDLTNCFLKFSDEEMYGEVLKVVLEEMESEFGVFGYLDENGDWVVPLMTMHIWDKCKVSDKNKIFPREKWGNSSWPRAIREKRVIYSMKYPPTCRKVASAF